jgi:tRNA(fMet)-specific endonuclease VapC
MCVLDTDTLTLWFRGHPIVAQHVAEHSPEALAITIITVEEILSGWYRLIRQARDDETLVRVYHWLQQSVEFFRDVRILPLTRSAIQLFHHLRQQHRRIGTNDLRIAAIVLENGAALISRNRADFGGIAELRLEDWSV